MSNKLTPEMKDVMSKQRIFPLATASKDGIPNVVPVGLLYAKDDSTIWIVDNYMNKTLANVKENTKAAIYIWVPECKESFQVKGKISIENSGKDYEEAKAFAHSKKETLPAKNLLKFKIESIYSVAPGPNAGAKL